MNLWGCSSRGHYGVVREFMCINIMENELSEKDLRILRDEKEINVFIDEINLKMINIQHFKESFFELQIDINSFISNFGNELEIWEINEIIVMIKQAIKSGNRIFR